MKPEKIQSAVHVFWPLEDPAADGSRLYLRVPREVAQRVTPIRLDGAREPAAACSART